MLYELGNDLGGSMKQPKDAAINFRAPSALVDEAHACAREWGVNVSQFIREAMSLQLNVERERRRFIGSSQGSAIEIERRP